MIYSSCGKLYDVVTGCISPRTLSCRDDLHCKPHQRDHSVKAKVKRHQDVKKCPTHLTKVKVACCWTARRQLHAHATRNTHIHTHGHTPVRPNGKIEKVKSISNSTPPLANMYIHRYPRTSSVRVVQAPGMRKLGALR